MKQIAVIGLGGIAQKAYLPVMRDLSDVTWHLYTRNQAVLMETAGRFDQVRVYSSLDDLLNQSLDGVFIHAATSAHEVLARQCLQRGLPVYLDKPLTEDYWTTYDLYRAAAQAGTFLMAGFNRRFAPHLSYLQSQREIQRMVFEKNEVADLGERRYKIFDLFIHPLDTALYLLGDAELVRGNFQLQQEGCQLRQVSVNLMTSQTLVTVSMNLCAGARREVMEVQSPAGMVTLTDLTDVCIHEGLTKQSLSFGSWESVPYKRGFTSSIAAFLTAIETGVNPVSPKSSLLSHWLCEQLCQVSSSFGELDVKLPIEDSPVTP